MRGEHFLLFREKKTQSRSMLPKCKVFRYHSPSSHGCSLLPNIMAVLMTETVGPNKIYCNCKDVSIIYLSDIENDKRGGSTSNYCTRKSLGVHF